MIPNNNNLTPLAWYNDIREQFHRQRVSQGQVYPLFTPVDTVLPFQILREHRASGVQSVVLRRADGTSAGDITRDMRESGLYELALPIADMGLDVIVYTATMPMALGMSEGRYYLELTDGVETWYSEVFTAVRDMRPYLRLEWRDVENLTFDAGLVIYDNPRYTNRIWLMSQLGRPEYKFEEEGEEREGYFFAEKRSSEKVYRFTALAPEYLLDALRLACISDMVRVTDRYGREYRCDTFSMSPEWEQIGGLASVAFEFETDTYVKRCGRTYMPTGLGDFDGSFNNDFFT